MNPFNVSLSFPCDKISLLHVIELSDLISKNHECITSHAAFLLPPPLYIKLNSCLHFIIVDICGIWNIYSYNAKLVWFIVYIYIYIKYIEPLPSLWVSLYWHYFVCAKPLILYYQSTLIINPRLMICLSKMQAKMFHFLFL